MFYFYWLKEDRVTPHSKVVMPLELWVKQVYQQSNSPFPTRYTVCEGGGAQKPGGETKEEY